MKICLFSASSDMRLSELSISGLDQATKREETAGQGGGGIERCPLCGHARTREWLRAPDRLHGRQEKYTLVRCSACSLVWLSNPPKPEEMHLHYTDAYDKLISRVTILQNGGNRGRQS